MELSQRGELTSKTLCLGDKEEGEEERDDAKTAPHEEDLGSQLGGVRLVGDEVRGDDTDDAVPEPVGAGGQTDTAGTDGEGEDFTNDDPGTRTPGDGKGGDVQADEGNHGLGGVLVVLSGRASSDTDDADNVLEGDHESGTADEQLTASNLLDRPERDRGRQDVDEGGDERDQERVLDRAELLEEDGAEVEDEVDTSELLHHLHEDTHGSAAGVGGWRADLALEASCPRTEITGLGKDGHLVLVVGNDLSEFILDVFGINGLATNTGKSSGGLVELSLLDKVTGRVREDGKTTSEDNGPQELHGNRDTVRASILALLGSVDDAVGEQNTDGDAELVAGNDSTTDLLGSNLGHVPVQVRL